MGAESTIGQTMRETDCGFGEKLRDISKYRERVNSHCQVTGVEHIANCTIRLSRNRGNRAMASKKTLRYGKAGTVACRLYPLEPPAYIDVPAKLFADGRIAVHQRLVRPEYCKGTIVSESWPDNTALHPTQYQLTETETGLGLPYANGITKTQAYSVARAIQAEGLTAEEWERIIAEKTTQSEVAKRLIDAIWAGM